MEIKRDAYLEQLKIRKDNGMIKIITGIRRCGKSFLLFVLFKKYLLESGVDNDHIIEIALDGIENEELRDPKKCYQHIKDAMKDDQKYYLLLDEVQFMSRFEEVLNSLLRISNIDVYVTGSNAKMLSSEIATTLGGRFLIQEVYPYSFREFLLSQDIILKTNWLYTPSLRNEVVRTFDAYFYNGGFPELIAFKDKRSWLSGLYQKIFFGDLVARYALRNSDSMSLLVKKLAESVMQPSSYNRLKNIVSSAGESVGVRTVIDYVGYLEETWLIFSIENYAARFAERESNRKYYFIDNGILNLFIFNPETLLLENLVAVSLYRMVGKELYFYNQNVEVDFYIPDQKWLVQASYNISDTQTFTREVNGLLKTAKFLKAEKLQIVTRNEERTVEQDGFTIEVIPIWKWMIMLENK